MTEALTSWLDQLAAKPLPVWREARRALLDLAARGDYNGPKLMRAAAHDALLCAQILRAANTGKHGGDIGTLEQAAVMLGANRLHSVVEALPVLEDSLSEADLIPLRALQRRDFHVANLARELTRRHQDVRYDDAFFAGLLHSLGEMALRAHSPRVVPQVRRLSVKQGIPLGEAAEAVLGFQIPALAAALAQRWRLPTLVCAALDADHQQDRRAELVSLAAGILNAGADALRPAAEDSRVQRAAQLLRAPVAEIQVAVFKACAEAAAWLCRYLPRPGEPVVELFPQPPVDSHEDEPPAPAAAPQPEAVARFEALVDSGKKRVLPLQQVIDEFATALHNGLGLDRVVFATLTPDRLVLKGRVFRGVAADSPLHAFEFPMSDANLLTKLMERPGAAFVTARPSAQLAPLLTPALRAAVDAREFFVQSVFLGNRPAGLCYADRATSGRRLSNDEYARFRHNCQALQQHLARHLPRRSD